MASSSGYTAYPIQCKIGVCMNDAEICRHAVKSMARKIKRLKKKLEYYKEKP